MRPRIVWDPLSPGYVADPYPTYRELREWDPVHWSASNNQFVVSRYADCERILRDDSAFSKDYTEGDRKKRSAFRRSQSVRNLATMDPPDHTRLRRALNPAFTPRAVAALEDFIRRSTHQLLDAVRDAQEFDLIRVLANPLPVMTIGRIIGIPEEETEGLTYWGVRYLRVLEPIPSREDMDQVLNAEKYFSERFTNLAEQRRREPRDDLVTHLVAAGQSRDALTSEEITTLLRVILLAGHVTTVNMIGNGMHALMLHPGQMELLRARPDLRESAIEELLRWDSPVQLLTRFTAVDMEVGDRFIEADSKVNCLLGSANRDADRFEEPDKLDITRSDNAHLAFGRGIHRCVGPPLARLEMRIVLEELLERFTDIRPGTRRPQYSPSVTLRGLKHLDVRVRRRPRSVHRASHTRQGR